jgi:hypothetical protein
MRPGLFRTFAVILLSAVAAGGQSYYDIGETVSPEHQQIEIPVCANGDGTLSLADLNGNLNGGNYRVIWLSFFASW